MVSEQVNEARGPRPWSRAWADASFGEHGFWTVGPGAAEGPSEFFRTSVHVGATFHRAIAALLLEVDARLGHPEHLDLVDVGAGGGELLAGVLDALPAHVAVRTHPVAIEVRAAPRGLDPRITWVTGAAPESVPPALCGLVVAHEWLDEIPVDVVQVDGDGVVRLVLVDRDGDEHPGPTLDDDIGWATRGLDAPRARSWLDQQWPLEHPGDRAEIGHPRDEAWRGVVARLGAGTALAVDYGHPTGWGRGTLVGHDRRGRAVRAVPDGSVNLTSHVVTASVAACVGATVTRQREALRELGISAVLPERDLALSDPAAYADALVAASDAAELLDPTGLGDFRWIRVDR